MKKIWVLFVLVLYASASMGATIHLHFCMNKFAGWALSNTIQEKCPKCGMEEGGCCKDEAKSFQVSKDQLKALIGFSNTPFSKIIRHQDPLIIFQLLHANQAAALDVVDPPPLLKRNQRLAFYGVYLI